MSNEEPLLVPGWVVGYCYQLSDTILEENPSTIIIKPLKEFNRVSEIRIDSDKDTYRAVYTFKLGTKIYVLHVFKKKSTKGIATPKKDMDVIQKRLEVAKELAKDE